MHANPDPRDVRILVVDDQAVVRVALRGILASVGYRVTEASSMGEALEWVDREPFHIILSDVEMPGGSGLDLVKALETRFPAMAVIVVSGLDDAELALDCLQHGAYGYVLKPFQPREILLHVSSALRRRMLELAYLEREHELERRVRKATEMIRILVRGHEGVAKTARELFPKADEANDQPTADLLTQRLDIHEKTAWMLRSLLEE